MASTASSLHATALPVAAQHLITRIERSDVIVAVIVAIAMTANYQMLDNQMLQRSVKVYVSYNDSAKSEHVCFALCVVCNL
jgi:hypothetical protein